MATQPKNISFKRLIFAYIRYYRCLYNVKLNFDAEYSIDYNPKTMRLSIKRNMAWDGNFWPESVSSVSVIAGQNGTGKTSVLRWLVDKTLPCGSEESLNGIMVIQDGENINIYHDIEGLIYTEEEEVKPLQVILHNVKGWNSEKLSAELGLNPIYYSGHFDCFVGSPSAEDEENRIWNISDQSLLLTSVEEVFEKKSDSLGSHKPIADFLNSYHIQNDIRICRLLLDSRFQETFKEKDKYILRLPRYIVFIRKEDIGAVLKTRIENLSRKIDVDEGKGKVLKKRPKSELHKLQEIEKVRPNEHMQNLDQLEGKVGLSEILYYALKRLCYHLYVLKSFNPSLKNLIINLYTNDYPSTQLSAVEWVKKAQEDVEATIVPSNRRNAKTSENEILDFFLSLKKTLKFLIKLKWKDKKAFIDCVGIIKDPDFIPPKGAQRYAEHMPYSYKRFFEDIHQIERFCNITYSHVQTEDSSLSSGELAMLNLYSRIKYAFDNSVSSNQKDRQLFLILDEAEIGFHPEWQRQFVNRLTQFVSRINQGNVPVQIIYTTHSPITLSDMPKDCVNLLKVINNESVSVPPDEKKETFGSNVFELYGDSFFMEHGLIGEFASEKIRKLSSEIEELVAECGILSDTGKVMNSDGFLFDGNRIHNLRSRIDMIGDERIRAYLNSRLDMADPNEEIRYLKERLAFLEEQFNRNNEKD